jgi:hypothetical protein
VLVVHVLMFTGSNNHHSRIDTLVDAPEADETDTSYLRRLAGAFSLAILSVARLWGDLLLLGSSFVCQTAVFSARISVDGGHL